MAAGTPSPPAEFLDVVLSFFSGLSWHFFLSSLFSLLSLSSLSPLSSSSPFSNLTYTRVPIFFDDHISTLSRKVRVSNSLLCCCCNSCSCSCSCCCSCSIVSPRDKQSFFFNTTSNVRNRNQRLQRSVDKRPRVTKNASGLPPRSFVVSVTPSSAFITTSSPLLAVVARPPPLRSIATPLLRCFVVGLVAEEDELKCISTLSTSCMDDSKR